MLQGEISGFREDLFSPRKSALNLLGVISISKVSITNSRFFICLQQIGQRQKKPISPPIILLSSW